MRYALFIPLLSDIIICRDKTNIIFVLGKYLMFMQLRYLIKVLKNRHYSSSIREGHASFSPGRPRFDPMAAHMGFVVDKVALR